MANLENQNSTAAIDARSRAVSWYIPKIGDKLGDAQRELFEKYSKIAPEDVEAHIYKIRDKAFEVHRYPCIGGFRFLNLQIPRSPSYPNILNRLKTNPSENFLDLGCCFGQEIRKLTFDGVPSSQLWGSDLHLEFIELGYALFKDRETLESKFIAGDVFDPASPLADLDCKIDIINAGAFLHLFSYDDQVRACERIVKLLKPKEGSVLLGTQVGSSVPRAVSRESDPTQTRWRHDEESFKKMWREVGEKTGSRWKVDVNSRRPNLEDFGLLGVLADDDTMFLRFEVWRE